MGRNKPHKFSVPHRPKLKKDPGVPKLPDLKIRNGEKQKARSENATMASEPTLSSLARLASSVEQAQACDASVDSTSPAQKTKEQVRRHYVRALHKVIDESDIIILVLDARDPEGCRSRLVEEEVRRRESEGKKLVFVLNKIGARVSLLENAQQWLRYLRHYTPTLPFRSAAANQRSNLSSATAPALLRLLKAYKPSAAQSVTVGVVGFPNVGKSSLINSLKRSKACAVAAQPGHTKDLQTVQLERGLKIIDSPGVVFDEDEDEDLEILSRTERMTLQNIYGLPEFSNTLEFLTMLALSSGRLLKGGTPDVLSAARQVLMDWNHQKIPYFSDPPTIHPSMIPSTIPNTAGGSAVVAPGAETVGQAQILTDFSKPFELAGLFGAADAGAFASEVTMGDDTAEHEAEMVADDTPLHVPLKRSHSPDPGPESESRSGSSVARRSTSDMSFVRTPKRFRRAKDLSAYEEAAVESHPLRRKTLKKDAKRARRAATRVQRRSGQGVGMEVDDLRDTFMMGSGVDMSGVS
ncbi:P-loop containing nucleoside triphosphate hydrolase protein [Boletus edulis BED1]|uniref:P-loop containing nucleoside triphosphate hydrolase protein n=1 Tax=Boletus edulis BED1 TaxID=1328754 RepID=A0AAD4BE72_BOLED|nr:P-loop containing nucleoside triphosphate hydrolase protein [Boletus edulis BED1]